MGLSVNESQTRQNINFKSNKEVTTPQNAPKTEDKQKSHAAAYMLGATALAAIVIGGIASKGKLWGKGGSNVTNVKNVLENMKKLGMKVPEFLQKELQQVENATVKSHKGGKIKVRYKDAFTKQEQILVFNNKGEYLHKISHEGNGFSKYDADNKLVKSFVRTKDGHMTTHYKGYEITPSGVTQPKAYYEETVIKSPLQNGVKGSTKKYSRRTVGRNILGNQVYEPKGSITTNVINTGNGSIIIQNMNDPTLGNFLHKVKVNGKWIEVQPGQKLSEILSEEQFNIAKKAMGLS